MSNVYRRTHRSDCGKRGYTFGRLATGESDGTPRVPVLAARKIQYVSYHNSSNLCSESLHIFLLFTAST